jgi:hypothetical protein
VKAPPLSDALAHGNVNTHHRVPPSAPLPPHTQNYSQLGNSLRGSLGLAPVDAAAALPAPPEVDDPDGTGPLVPSAPAGARVQVGAATVPFRPEWDRVRLTPRHTAYLRVAEGCNHAVGGGRGWALGLTGAAAGCPGCGSKDGSGC